MNQVTSSIRAGLTLTVNGTDYYMEKGQEISELVVAGPYTDEVVGGVLVGFSVRDRHSINDRGRIYDGIPTYMFSSDQMANIKDLELTSEAAFIMIASVSADTEEDDEDAKITLTKVNVDRIKSISGDFVDPEGNETLTVDLGDEEISVVKLIEEATEEAKTTLVLNEGSVEEAVTVKTDIDIKGENANVPQNFDQNPEEEVA